MPANPLVIILSAEEFISAIRDVNSSKTEDIFSTGFIGITEQKKILDEAKKYDLINHDIVSQGGYPNSNRKIISLLPKTVNTVLALYKTPFKVIEASDDALYGLIALNYPNVCGDEIRSPIVNQIIIYTPQQAILDNIVDTLKSNKYKIVDTTHLLTKNKTDMMELYEASTRLDALTSAIWKVSRTSIIKFINAGLVSLDTTHTVTKPDKKLSIGDTIYCDNKGRAVIQSITPTKKDRYKISVTKYM